MYIYIYVYIYIIYIYIYIYIYINFNVVCKCSTEILFQESSLHSQKTSVTKSRFDKFTGCRSIHLL